MAIQWGRRKYTEEEFRTAWASSKSVSEVVRRLGYSNLGHSGGHSYTVKKTGQELGLSFDHFDPYWVLRKDNPERSKTGTPARKLEDILVNGISLNTHGLKGRLIREGLKTATCEICGTSEWFGVPVPIVLDHINGDNRDNRLDNLRVICRNCDGTLPTFGSKNRSSYAVGKTAVLCSCGGPKYRSSKVCLSCHRARRPTREPSGKGGVWPKRPEAEKIEWPSSEELRGWVEQSNYTRVGKMLGVSDNAVRKRLRDHP